MDWDVHEMERAGADAVANFARRPLWTPPLASTIYTIVIDKGNTLTDGSDGIKFVSPPLTSIPAYDPTVTSSFMDGVGRGTLYRNGTALGYVLVVNDGRGGVSGFDLLGGAIADTVIAGAPAVIGTGAAAVRAYYPVFL